MPTRNSKIEIEVSIAARGKSIRNGWRFEYKSTSEYVDKTTGDITIPTSAGEQTLVFILATPFIAWGTHESDRFALSLQLGRRSNGNDVLSIWREGNPEKPHPSAAFSYPALSRDNKGRDNVTTTNYNLTAGSYRYCLTFGLMLGGGRILKIDNDPRIKN